MLTPNPSCSFRERLIQSNHPLSPPAQIKKAKSRGYRTRRIDMRTDYALLKALLFCAVILVSSPAWSDCRKVGPITTVTITPLALKTLAAIGMGRAKIFDALKEVSIPETEGCWAGATGDFDKQIVSVGTLQWNYGQNSLQPLMRRYRDGLRSIKGLTQEINRTMPKHGRLILSNGCLREPVTDDCRESILALQENGRLKPSLKAELDTLFETDAMIQIQTDKFVALLQSVQDDLQRVFYAREPTLKQIKWAIDTKVQQGGFPGDADISRIRAKWSKLATSDRSVTLLALVDWYAGLSSSIDQGGTGLDRKCNIQHWREKIKTEGVSEEQADLLNLSFLKSRTARTMSGYWQALTFERRAKIILAIGSVAGNRVGIPNDSECLRS